MMEPIGFGIAAAVWRYIDGSDNRPKGSNLMGIGIVLATVLWLLYPFHNILEQAPLLLPALVTAWLMIRGMPGWTEWKPMLLGFAVPTAIAASVFSFANLLIHGQFPPPIPAIGFGASGLAVAATYVLLSRKEARHPSWFKSFTAEQWSRLSYGFIVGGLALL